MNPEISVRRHKLKRNNKLQYLLLLNLVSMLLLFVNHFSTSSGFQSLQTVRPLLCSRARRSILSERFQQKDKYHRYYCMTSKSNYDTEEDTNQKENLRQQQEAKNDDEEEDKQVTLEWETFDFSDSPKWDSRFLPNGKSIHTIFETELNDIVMEEEARQDELLARQQKDQRLSLLGLSRNTVNDAIRILKPYVKQERFDRIISVLKQRTKHTQFLFENPTNPSNVWACLRTMDSFGIQHVHIVTETKLYQGKAALLQKQGMRTAMGSAQWLTIHHYTSTEEAIQTLRDEHNCYIFASDLNPSSIDIRDIDWNGASEVRNTNHENCADNGSSDGGGNSGRPLCIVMGNELKGISDTMRQKADCTFDLPMVGFAESFNLSVATAITLAYLSAASGRDDQSSGPIRPGDLPQDEFNALVLRGLVHSISQKRVAQTLLKQEGILLPDSFYQKGINLGKKLIKK